jgi:phycobilisome core-membrane linker protein
MVNSMEYLQVFNEDVVPYRRFPTLPAANFPNTEKLYNQLTKQNDDLVVPSFKPVKSRIDGSKMPLMSKSMADMAAQARQPQKSQESLVVGLGRSSSSQGQAVEVANARRQAARIYRFTSGMQSWEIEATIEAIYVQVMDLYSGQIDARFRRSDLENKLGGGQISIREFVRQLASSETYRDRFYTPYPNAKVIEFLFRHLLGRTPSTQAEIKDYNQLLTDRGLKAVVDSLIDSPEYALYFGEDVVPYQRVLSLPGGNYLGSIKEATGLVEQP